MKANYHTHTARGMHASGRDDDYVRAAIEGGFDVLGFADHTPWPYRTDFVSGMRMTVRELDGYVRSVRALRAAYVGQIDVLLGLECEYFPDYIPWLRDTMQAKGVDYAILGSHYDLSDETGIYFGYPRDAGDVRRYVKRTVAGMETGLFAYLAHPDLFMLGYGAFDRTCAAAARALCEAANALRLPLEYNLAGLRAQRRRGIEGYPHERFWEIAAAMGCRAIIGVDAHAPKRLTETDLWQEAVDALCALGMERVERLEL